MKPRPFWYRVAEWFFLMLGLAALGVALAMCAGCIGVPSEYVIKLNPATGEGIAALSKVSVIEPVSGSHLMQSDVTEPEAGMGWLGIIGLALGGTGALTSLLPKGQAIWSMLLTKAVPLGQKIQGAAALPLPMINSPPAAHAITDKRRAAKKEP